MAYPVTYYCPHCGAVAELDREGYLADRSVTPYPLVGWDYATPEEAFEQSDGVAFTCGADGTLVAESASTVDETAESPPAVGCGERFYLNFVRFEDGVEVTPRPESEYVRLGR